MTKKRLKQILIIIFIGALTVGYFKYMDVHDMDKVRRAQHFNMITPEELNTYVEEKEIYGIQYNPSTNFLTGVLTDSAMIKYGISPDENPKIMLGGVLEAIENGDITNEAIIDKVDTTVEKYQSSYINSFVTFIFVGLILLGLIYVLSLRSNSDSEMPTRRGVSYAGKGSKDNKIEAEEVTGVSLDDVKGHDEIKDDIQFIIKMIKKPEKYEKLGAKVPKGVLLFGPPGTGKTMLAKAIANEVGVPFYAAGGSDFVEKYVGVGAKRVRELFTEAKKHEKAIIYIDEIDAIGRKRGDNDNDERTGTLNALLMEMDGFGKSDNIMVIASTNRVDVLDDALLRPGRFDKHVAVSTPDYKGRLEILNLYAKNKRLDKDVNMDYVAKITRGFSGAELANLLNEAAMITAFRDKDTTTMLEIDDAYYKIVTKGDKKKSFDRSVSDTEITAWHEAGHAIVSWALAKQKVNKVTIIPSTSGAGGITLMEPKDGDYYSKKDLENMVKVCYGGRAAEYLLLGDEDSVTTGASNDIEKATNIIMSMLATYGMSPKFGLINITKIEGLRPESLLVEAKEVSEKIYQSTKEYLKEHYKLLKELSELLVEKETVDEKEIDDMFNSYFGEEIDRAEPQIIIASFDDEDEKKSLKKKIFGDSKSATIEKD